MEIEYKDKKDKIRCNFSDNVVEYLVKCNDEIENYLNTNENIDKLDLFNKVNEIFANNFKFGQDNPYLDSCPHLEENPIEYSEFRIQWCYNDKNINDTCDKCETHHREWSYKCCLDEKCVYGILMEMFDSLIDIYTRDGEEKPESREWIVSNIPLDKHQTRGVLEIQLDIYYKNKIPQHLFRIN